MRAWKVPRGQNINLPGARRVDATNGGFVYHSPSRGLYFFVKQDRDGGWVVKQFAESEFGPDCCR